MKRLHTSKIVLGMLLLAMILVCSLKSRPASAAPQPATTAVEAPSCPCEKPQTLEQPLSGGANIVARMLEI